MNCGFETTEEYGYDLVDTTIGWACGVKVAPCVSLLLVERIFCAYG
jgi:hypothetical protein